MAIIRKRHFTQPSNQTPIDIAVIDTPEKLLRFAESQGLGPVPLNVKAIAEKFGIRVESVPLEDDLSGILFKDEERDTWVIQVNEEHHPNRQRYTIAHELGHFCLHKHLDNLFKDYIFFRGEVSSKVEWQANDFASSILIPEQTFRDTVRSGMGKVEDLAKKFEVSTLALRIRAKNLGMSGHGL